MERHSDKVTGPFWRELRSSNKLERQVHEADGDPEARRMALNGKLRQSKLVSNPEYMKAWGVSVSPQTTQDFVYMCIFSGKKRAGISSCFQIVESPTVLLSSEATGSWNNLSTVGVLGLRDTMCPLYLEAPHSSDDSQQTGKMWVHFQVRTDSKWLMISALCYRQEIKPNNSLPFGSV